VFKEQGDSVATLEEVTPKVEEKIQSLGFELFEMRFFRAGSRSILRVVIDKADGVKIADCAYISNELSALLDELNFADDRAYNLEVSSPGIDRPLKTEKDYRRIKGHDVRLHCTNGIDGKKTIVGEVVDCSNDVLTITTGNKTVQIPLSDIYSGKEELRFK
jgi:ribosome maturation factor RimP